MTRDGHIYPIFSSSHCLLLTAVSYNFGIFTALLRRSCILASIALG